MSKLERMFHALLFEFFAILISIIAVKFSSTHSTINTTVVIILISLIAVLWNMVFNGIFDQFFTAPRENRSIPLRICHTLLFEGGLLLLTLPMIVYVLNISWLEAFIMDIGLTLLILVYTFFFNFAYDHLRATLMKNRL